MALADWQVIARSETMVALAIEGAVLLIESPRPASGDPSLDELIGRLAPHLAFGDVRSEMGWIEREAVSERDGRPRTSDERMVVGRYTRGALSIGYLVASRAQVDIREVLKSMLHDMPSPFEYLSD